MNLPNKGTIAEHSFIEILRDASSSNLTGMVRLEKGSSIKVIYVSQGTIAFASSNEKQDRLTEVLRRAGKLTTEQIEDAQARLKPNVSLGKTLVELGYISPKDLLWGARNQVEGILYQLLFWTDGNFQIMQGALPKEIVSLGLQVPQIIYDGIMKTQDRQWVLDHIGTPQAIYKVVPNFEELNAVYKLQVHDIAARMNGRRSLEEIAQGLNLESFDVCKTAVALQRLELAEKAYEKPVQMPLLQQAEEPQQEAEPPAEDNVSLGQVLQIPTVQELQTIPETPESQEEAQPVLAPVEEAEEEIAPTIAIAGRFSEQPQAYSADAADTLVPDSSVSLPVPEYVPESEPMKAPEPLDEPEEPPLSFVEHSTSKNLDDIHKSAPGFSYSARKPGKVEIDWRKIALIVGAFAVIAVGVAFFYRKYNSGPASTTDLKPAGNEQPATRANPPAQKPAEPVATPESEPLELPATAEPENQNPQPTTTTPKPEPAKVVPPAAEQVTPPVEQKQPPPSPAPTASPAMAELRQGNLTKAASLWNAQAMKQRNKYTIQIVLACQDKTVVEAFQNLNYSSDLAIIPIQYKGKSCYRVIYGTYTSSATAQQARSNLPGAYLSQQAPAQVVQISKIVR